jgi:SAM-dependent methyltransferase
VEPVRSEEQLRRHYEVERGLADRLRAAGREERSQLYSEVYDELFARVPDHPQLAWKADPAIRAARIDKHLRTLQRFLRPESTFLEVGAGDCALALRVAERVRRVYAVEVSEEIARVNGRPDNLELLLTDGRTIPVPAGSVQVAFSDQLMEHLHPDDAVEQLQGIHDALAPGGVYICITPNRLSGPHDVSKYFDDVATGFHLKEYTSRELGSLMRAVGFSRVQTFLTRGTRTFVAPLDVAVALEAALAAGGRPGRRLARLCAPVLGNRVMATK